MSNTTKLVAAVKKVFYPTTALTEVAAELKKLGQQDKEDLVKMFKEADPSTITELGGAEVTL